MSKRLIVILALAFAVGISAAYAEVQNVKVSGDITVSGINRYNAALKDVADFETKIHAILSQVRLKVDADLTDNVSTTVRLLNERIWGAEFDSTTNSTTSDTDINLDLAYVTLKEFLYSPLTLVIGRQELRYGNALIIGDVDTNMIAVNHAVSGGTRALPKSLDDLSLRKSFDAVKAILNYDPLVVDLFYAKVQENAVGKADDVDLYGINANYAGIKNLGTEAYLFQRSRKENAAGTAINEKEDLITVGAKGVYTGIENVMLSLETAYQFGDHLANTTYYPDELSTNSGMRKASAWALQGIGSLVLPKIKHTPILSGSYTFFSGDKWKSSHKYTGWDPMYEDTLGGTILNKLIYNNFHLFNAGVSIKPMDDLKVALQYYYALLQYKYPDNTTATLNGVSGDPTYKMTNEKGLGNEIDLGLTYDYTEDVQFGLNAGMFIPGEAFQNDNSATASQVIGSMKVTF